MLREASGRGQSAFKSPVIPLLETVVKKWSIVGKKFSIIVLRALFFSCNLWIMHQMQWHCEVRDFGIQFSTPC